MSFGLGRGRQLDDAPGVIGLSPAELPPLPDAVMTNPEAGRIDPRIWFPAAWHGRPAHVPSESTEQPTGQTPVPHRPFEIEIGCGKGGFILQEAAANPGVNYLGIEYAREFYLYTADRLRRRALSNVRMLHADATEFLQWRCPSAIVRTIHLYFSDPWPKKKHHKNRVIQDRFLAECWRVLVPGGELRVVTDHDELWAWDVEHFDRWTNPGGAIPDDVRARCGLPPPPEPPFLRRDFSAPTWAEEGETVGTNYERKMCPDRPPHACVLVKRG